MSASHTIRHYVKYLRCTSYDLSLLWPARTSRRQGGVLLQGHPRPLPVAKPRTLRDPAHKVQPVWAVVGDGRLSLAWSVVCCSAACRLQHFVPDKEDALTVAGSLQIIFLVFRFRAGSLQLRQSAAKKAGPFPLLSVTPLPQLFRLLTSYAYASR